MALDALLGEAGGGASREPGNRAPSSPMTARMVRRRAPEENLLAMLAAYDPSRVTIHYSTVFKYGGPFFARRY